MRPYLRETSHHRTNALKLYRWNIAVSGAFYQALHVFEVVLRNSINARLRLWNSNQNDSGGRHFDTEWCRRPAPLLARLLGRDANQARARAEAEFAAKKKRTAPAHDDIVAQLNLGTWRFLLPSRSDTGKAQLWSEGLDRAFAHRTRPVEELVEAVDGVYRLRNRIAHLEPLTKSNLHAQYKNLQTVLGDIEPRTREWLVSASPIPKILEARPVSG